MSVAQYHELLASQHRSKVAGVDRASPEEDLHRLCFSWVELKTLIHPILQYLVHVPNGGARSKGEAGKLKAMGVKPGVPDFLLPRSVGQWRGLAIELKSDVGRLTLDQKLWLSGLSDEGYLVSVCRSLDAFDKVVTAFLHGQSAPLCIERGWEVSQLSTTRR